MTSQYTSGLAGVLGSLPEQARAVADSGLAGALAVAGGVGGTEGELLVQTAKEAFVDGLNLAAGIGAVVVFVAAVASWKLLPRTTSAPFVAPTAAEPTLAD